mgnify:CR=1 FL=1
MITCPQCEAAIDVEEEELDEGEKLMCEDCGVHLVVTGVDPLEIAMDEDSEGFDDEDEDDEDYDEEADDEESEDEEEEDWR